MACRQCFSSLHLPRLTEELSRHGLATPGRYNFMFPFCAHAWRGDMRSEEGSSSSLAWVMLPSSALGLPICAHLLGCHCLALRVLVACWLITAWQAAYSVGLRVLVWGDLITWIALRAFAAPFVAGVALGLPFSKT